MAPILARFSYQQLGTANQRRGSTEPGYTAADHDRCRKIRYRYHHAKHRGGAGLSVDPADSHRCGCSGKCAKHLRITVLGNPAHVRRSAFRIIRVIRRRVDQYGSICGDVVRGKPDLRDYSDPRKHLIGKKAFRHITTGDLRTLMVQYLRESSHSGTLDSGEMNGFSVVVWHRFVGGHTCDCSYFVATGPPKRTARRHLLRVSVPCGPHDSFDIKHQRGCSVTEKDCAGKAVNVGKHLSERFHDRLVIFVQCGDGESDDRFSRLNNDHRIFRLGNTDPEVLSKVDNGYNLSAEIKHVLATGVGDRGAVDALPDVGEIDKKKLITHLGQQPFDDSKGQRNPQFDHGSGSLLAGERHRTV